LDKKEMTLQMNINIKELGDKSACDINRIRIEVMSLGVMLPLNLFCPKRML
jgi:hypothetical protein